MRAARYFDLAGRRAASSAALAEAAAHYRRGLELLEETPQGPERAQCEQSLLTMLGNALMGLEGIGAEATGEVWRRACAVTESRGDLEELTSTLNGLAVFELDRGELRRSLELGERILAIGERIDSRVARLRGQGTIGISLYYLGEGKRGLHHLRASAEAYRPGDFRLVTYGLGHDQGVLAHGAAAHALCWLGRLDEAIDEAHAALELAEQIGSFLSLAMARHFFAHVHHYRREHQDSLRISRANVEMCREMRFTWWEGQSHLVAGTQRALLGDANGLAEISDGLGLLGAVESRSGLSLGLSLLTEAHRAAGDGAAALSVVEGTLATEPPLRQWYYGAQLLRLHAELLLEVEGDAAGGRAERLLHESLTVAERQGAVLFGLRAATSLARLLTADGRAADARSLLGRWVLEVRGGEGTSDLTEARELLATSAEL